MPLRVKTKSVPDPKRGCVRQGRPVHAEDRTNCDALLIDMCARRTAFDFDENNGICSLGCLLAWKPPAAQAAVFPGPCSAPLNLVLSATFVGAKARPARDPFVRDLRSAANAKAINLRHKAGVQSVSSNCSVGFRCGLLVATRVPQVFEKVEWG